MCGGLNVGPERVDWLWHGYLPLGKLVTLDGDPDIGKSTLAEHIAAVVSTGGKWPDGSLCQAADVLILSAEDGLGLDNSRLGQRAHRGDPERVTADRGRGGHR